MLRKRAVLRWIPASVFAIIIFAFSSMSELDVRTTYKAVDTLAQPTAASTSSASPVTISGVLRKIPILTNINLLKVGHAIGYFFLGVSVLYGLGWAAWRWPWLAAAGICCLYAVSDELHQWFVPGRSSSVVDVILDSLAAFCGAGVLFLMRRKSNRSS